MRHPPDLRPSDRHRPLYPAPGGREGPNIVIAFVPAGLVVLAALGGRLYGGLVPTNETLALREAWGPVVAVVATGLTALIALRCRVPIIEEIVPLPLLQLGAVAFAGWLAWIAAPAFISHGLPAMLPEPGERTPATHVVAVLATNTACGAYRGRALRRFGAIVRSDRIGGPAGQPICRIPPEVWNGLRPGDRLVLHGYQGRWAFHYEQITR